MDARTDLVAPDDIDLSFAPRLVPDLFAQELDGELVVVGGPTRVVALNPTAGMIFQFFDGATTLTELSDDLSDALAADLEAVRTDVLEFAQDLGRRGLLDGVGVVTEWPSPTNWTPPQSIDVGEELPEVELLDLHGAWRSLAEFRGRRVLLVNWSPHCGFCTKIAPDLAEAADALETEDVALVFLASGDAEENQAVFTEAGLDSPLLLRDGTEDDPFRGTGTPAAYLLDAEGRLARTMAVGADQVPMLVTDLTGRVASVPDDAGGVDSGVQYLPAPAAMCGSGGGGGGGSTEWVGTRVYRLGDFHVGVRFDAADTAAVLDRLFPGASVVDHRAPDNYSVALALNPAEKGAARSLHLLVRGSAQLVRTRSSARVLAALLAYLSAELPSPATGLARLNATAAVHEGDALLLPQRVAEQLPALQPRLHRLGVRLVDAPLAEVDLATGELVVSPPTIAFDQSVLDELDASAPPSRSEPPRVTPGRYPLRAWCFAQGEQQGGPLSTAAAVTAALPLLVGLVDDELRGAVATLANLFERVDAEAMWVHDVAGVVRGVEAALGAKALPA